MSARGAAAWLLCVGLLGPACAEPAGRSGESPVMGPQELAQRIAAGRAPFVLDVRTPEEYASGRVPGAYNVPLDQLERRRDEIPSDVEVVVYCERGPRAARAEAALREAGYSQLRRLEGDMSGWRSGQLPCESC